MKRTYLAVAALGVAVASPGEAQDPPAPPGVILPSGGPRTIAGIVVDRNTSPSIPLEGVAITIRGSNRTVITGDDGVFRFDSLEIGEYEIRARRIGYEPQVQKATIPGRGNVIFVLTPLSQRLAPIVSAAAVGGVGGFVSDSIRKPLKGVTVRVFGTQSGRAVTDSSGQFHVDAPAGQYMMEVTSRGFRPEMLSFNIPADSGRLVAITLYAGRIPSREVVARQDLQQRVSWRKVGARVFTREDLARMAGTSLTDIVRMGVDRPFDVEECALLLNGYPIAWPMWMYNAEDLDMVEVYPPGTMGHTQRGRRVQTNPRRDSRGSGGADRVCPDIFIWQRK
jgi:hypothetical protein